jgi:diadenosine tetraphosphate (Ap4A) HIT family hydrolase
MLGKMIVMGIEHFTIHPQLLTDSHELFNWQSCHVRLHKNASLPWIIIIPDSELSEFHDLAAELQLEITKLSKIISNYYQAHCGTEKINFAAIGNVVPQLHIHVVGRHKNDPLWPDVVWGNQLPEATYSQQAVENIKFELQQRLSPDS